MLITVVQLWKVCLSVDLYHHNKLASLGATLVRNYDPATYLLTDRGKV